MPVSVNDIIQITDVQKLFGETVLNVYFYEVLSAGSLTSLNDITDAFQLMVLTPIAEEQTSDLEHTMTIAKNLTTAIDIFEDAWSHPGESGDTALASFYALSFRLVRSTGLTRHGAKRIAGFGEGSVDGNSLAAGGVISADSCAAAMLEHLEETGVADHNFEAIPVIVGRKHIGTTGAGELDLTKINPVSAVQFIRVSTQTTRRAGRGV